MTPSSSLPTGHQMRSLLATARRLGPAEVSLEYAADPPFIDGHRATRPHHIAAVLPIVTQSPELAPCRLTLGRLPAQGLPFRLDSEPRCRRRPHPSAPNCAAPSSRIGSGRSPRISRRLGCVHPADRLARHGRPPARLGDRYRHRRRADVQIAVSYGMLIRTFPVSGGEYAYAYTAFGRINAYICGWMLALGYISIVALNASALALLFRRLTPWLVEWVPLWSIAGWDVYLGEVVVAALALVIFGWLNNRGSALSGRMQFIFCAVMILGAVLLLVGTILHPDTPWSNFSPAMPEGVAPISAILAIVAIAPWAFVGFDNVPQAAEEFDFSPRKAFGLIIMAIVVAGLFYIAMILTTTASMPWTDLVASGPQWGTADGMANLFGAVGLLILGIAVAMGVFTGMNGFYVSASRLLFAMSRAKALPPQFGRTNRDGVPGWAVWFVAVMCLIAPWFGREVLSWIVDMTSVGVTIAYGYTCLAAFRLFRWSNSPEQTGDPAGVRSTPKKVLSLLGSITAVIFLCLLLVPGSPAQPGTPSFIALGVWVLLGVVFFISRRGADSQLDDDEMRTLVLGEHRNDEALSPDEN
ncbi:APC family permease [Parenemella sanctibonifatiensis]|uniref:APC family permease n=1 Tax=Parenemella sanctibonifatiensis TaxID=2016505 RepID=UPI002B4BC02C|nr:APC family permease [Parenemella sanctibonifatiensis]